MFTEAWKTMIEMDILIVAALERTGLRGDGEHFTCGDGTLVQMVIGLFKAFNTKNAFAQMCSKALLYL